MRSSLLLLLLVGACTNDAPVLHTLSCLPSPLHASATTHSLMCEVDFSGSPGDIRWAAQSTSGPMWTSGSGFIDTSAREVGRFSFVMQSPTAPPVGTLRITVDVDHVEGIDGPAGDSITTTVDVVQ